MRSASGAGSRRAFAPLSILLGVIHTLSVPQPAAAQSVQLQAGSSSLFSAHGGTVGVTGIGFTSRIGAGLLGDDFVVGFMARKRVRGVVVAVGDEAVDFRLPTDLFGGSRYLPVRGAGFEIVNSRSSFRFLAGATSSTLGAPFFRGANWGRPIGLIFYERRLTPRWSLFSKNAISESHTSIQGIEWRSRSALSLAAAGGIGNGEPYAAVSAALDQGWILANLAYVRQRTGFRRLTADSPMAAEPADENGSITLRPAGWWSTTLARQTLVDDGGLEPGGRRVTVNQAGASLNVAGIRLLGAVYDSHGPQAESLGSSLSVGRGIGSAFQVVFDHFRSDRPDERPSHSSVLRIEEKLHPRLTLSQAITRSAGQMTFSLGGELLTNPLRVTVTQQTVYAPLRIGNPFVHVIGIDLRISLFDRLDVQTGTYVTPDGRLRYTVSGTQVFSVASRGSGDSTRSFAFQRYVVRGLVRDTDGQPVAGAVIGVGDEIVLSDEAGRFFWRTSRMKRLGLEVATAEFLGAGKFEVVTAPKTVTPAPDGRASETVIVVRRN